MRKVFRSEHFYVNLGIESLVEKIMQRNEGILGQGGSLLKSSGI